MKKTVLAVLTGVFLILHISSCIHTSGTNKVSPVAHQAASNIIERGELVVGMTGDMPPLNMTNKNGEVIGMEPDMVSNMASSMGVNLKIKTMDFPELLPALERGDIDMVVSGMTATPKRNLKYAFVGPYYKSGKSLLTKLESLANIDDATELNSPETKLAVLENSTSQEFVEKVVPKAKLIKAKNYEEAVALILNDGADALVADFPICLVSVFRYSEENLIALAEPMTYEPISVAVSGSDYLMINWLENYLKTAEATGVLEKLKNKWMGDDSWLEQLP